MAEPSAETPSPPPAGRLAELRSSARGWQGIQLAVIGFIGLCGVLKQSDTAVPKWIQILAGVAALAALAIACLATYLVGRAAFPLYRVRGRAPPPQDDADELAHTSHRLIRGLALTFVAVALTALATASGWWPDTGKGGGEGDAGAFVELRTAQASVCGELADSGAGEIRVVTQGRTIAVPIQALTALTPVDGC